MATSAMGDSVVRELTVQPQAPSPGAGDLTESSKQPAIHTIARPPLAPSVSERTIHCTRKRSRSTERRVDDTQPCSSSTESATAVGSAADGVANGRQIETTLTSPVEERPSSANGGSTRAVTGGDYSTPSQQNLEPSPMATTPLILALTPSSQGREGPLAVTYNDIMLSDSEWEREIAEFGRQLDDMLSRVSDRVLVAQTAQYMRAYPQHTLRFQIKIKQRAIGESQRQSQTKLMLFYLFHEFLKLFQDDELRQIQREWYLTIDEVLHACMRDMKSNTDLKRRVFKTIARWEELGIYSPKIKQWKALASGEVKPRRGAMRLPRTEAERLAEAPDQLQQFPPPPVTKPQDQWNRANYAHLFERTNFRTALDLKQHWRYSAIAFIEALAKNLGISRDIAISACLFFHRVFDRGIYAKERFKFAAACIFLAAKASSKRMKLIRMVKTMHEILESPLLCGDEEILEMERMQLLHYEKLVLKGVDYALSTDLPFFHLETTLQQMPDKFRQDVEAGSLSVLEELFWLPLSLTTPPSFLAEAAAYISCRNNDRIFSFSWCREGKDGSVLTEKAAKEILKEYRQMREWKKDQEKHFAVLQKTSSSMGGPGPWDMQEVFKDQRGGLRVDVTSMENEAEYTQKGVNESRVVLTTYIDEDSSRSHTQRGTTTSSRPQSEEMARLKDEPRTNGRGDDRGSSRHDHGRYHDRDQRNNRDNGRGRRPNRDEERTAVKNESNSARSIQDEYGSDRRRDNDRDERDRDQDRGREKNGGKDRSPRRNGTTSRNRESDRDRKRDSDRGRDESRSRESRDRHRDRDRDRGDRDRKSSRRSRSRSPSPRHSSRSSKRVHRSSSRSRTKSRSRDRSPPRSSRNGDRKRSTRSRDRDRNRSPSSSRDRNRGRDRDRDRGSGRDRDRDRDRGRDRTRDRGRNDTRDRDRQRSDKRTNDRTDDRNAAKPSKEVAGSEEIKNEPKEQEVLPEKKNS